MKRKRNTKNKKDNKSPDVIVKDEDSVIEDSFVLLDFPEFHSTTIFQDSSFDLVSSGDSGTLYKISNCSFDKLRLDKMDTDHPICFINEYLPLKGTHINKGVTYVLVDKDSLNEPSSHLKYDFNSESREKSGIFFTDKCIEFSTNL